MAFIGARRALIKPKRASDAPQTTAFLARTSGLSATETAAYKKLINGLVADSLFTKLDVLYIFATNNTTTANLNLISTSFTGSIIGSPTFTADQGYTGAGGAAINSSLVLNAGGTQFTQNSGMIGLYDRTNRAASGSAIQVGANSVTPTILQIYNSGGNVVYDINEASFPSVALAASQGLYIASRTAASGAGAVTIYKNGSSIGANTAASGSPSSDAVYFLARNNGGTVNSSSTDQLSAGWIGAGLNATDALNLSNWINGYMTDLGINVY